MNKLDKTVLIVEDERPILEAIKLSLNDNGFEVLVARSVKEALELIKENNIDAVWLDHYLLGKENGLDFVTRVKAENEINNIPIFVVSNTASPSNVQTYIQLGVDKFYVKVEHKLEEIIEDLKNCIEEK